MSNNIVQLVDKNGNNIFPVAGSMASDSVTTAMLQDGAVTTDKIASSAVTSDKIDSTTMASMTAVTPINETKTWSGAGEVELISGTITLGKPSKVYISATAAFYPTSSGVRLMLRVDGVAVQNTVYTSQNAWITLTAPVIQTLSSGSHTISLRANPDGVSTAAGSARDYSLVAFEL